MLKMQKKDAEKNSEKLFCFLDNCIWIDCIKIVPIKKRIFVIGSQYVNKKSYDFAYH